MKGDGVLIDGSLGEGGGQVLRTALTLSVLTGRPFRANRIRSSRPNPGLAAQHLAAVLAAGRVASARVGGAELGSTDLYFEPGTIGHGNLSESIGTAGATSLVLQTVALPLCLAEGPSRVTLTGGTHVPWSPSHDFLKSDWVPAMYDLGLNLSVHCSKPGYYPGGAGEILALIPGGGRLKPLQRKVRGNLRSIRGRVFVSRMSSVIAGKVAREARVLLGRVGVASRVEVDDRKGAAGPGIGIHVEAVMVDESRVGFTSLGEQRCQPERVAREAVNALLDWLDTGAGVGPYLADQILLPLSLAEGVSVYSTSRITKHLRTNAEVIRRFVPTSIRIDGEDGRPGEIRVEGAPLS